MMKADKKRQYRGGETRAAEGDITRRGWDEWPGNAVVVETRRERRERGKMRERRKRRKKKKRGKKGMREKRDEGEG